MLLVLPAYSQVQFTVVESEEQMQEIYTRASAENLNIFVDVYATWCGPCKWMDANVFELESAGDYMNKEFINVKIDGDGEYGYTFARENGLEAYPSFFLFNSERQLMNKIVGAKPWEEFQEALEATVENYPVLALLQNKYESEMLEREEYAKFVDVLGEMGKDRYASSVAERYISTYFEEDLTMDTEFSDDDIRVVAMHISPLGPAWKIVTDDPRRLQGILGDDFRSFIDGYYNHMLTRAVEYESEEFIQELNERLASLTAGSDIDALELQTRAYVLFHSYTGAYEQLIAYIDSNYVNHHKGDHEWLFKAAVDAVFVDPGNSMMVEKGLEWFRECIDQHPEMDYYYHLGYCQYLSEDNSGAAESFKKALELAESDADKEEIRGIIEQLQAEEE